MMSLEHDHHIEEISRPHIEVRHTLTNTLNTWCPIHGISMRPRRCVTAYGDGGHVDSQGGVPKSNVAGAALVTALLLFISVIFDDFIMLI
jgi:hypothetical protein